MLRGPREALRRSGDRAAHTVDQVGWDTDDDRVFEIELPTPALFAEYAQGYAAVGVTEEHVADDTSPHRHLPGDTASTVKATYHALAARPTSVRSFAFAVTTVAGTGASSGWRSFGTARAGSE